MHFVASPPALEESLWGVARGGDSKHPSCRPLGTFRRGKVPRRRLLQKRLRRRAGIRFAYLVRTALCQSERGNFQNPLFQPHIFFSSRRKENVPLTVQKKRRPGEPQGDGSPSPGPPAERLSDGYFVILLSSKWLVFENYIQWKELLFEEGLSLFRLA